MIDMTMDWLADLSFGVLLEQCLKFYGELLLGFVLFAYPLRKRKYCLLKFAACVAAALAILIPIVFLGFGIWETYGFENYGVSIFLGLLVFFFLLLAFAFVLLTGRIAFAATRWELFFCGICGYSTQHICYRINLVLQCYFFFGTDSPRSEVLFWVSVAVVYGLMFLFFARHLKGRRTIEIENKRLIVLFGVVLLAMIVCSGLSMTYIGNAALKGTPMALVESAITIIVCYLAIAMLFDGARTKRIQEENRRIQALWKADRKQYEVSKQNVEQLNMKYHDLKYQLRAMRTDDSAAAEIEQSLRLYDSLYRTGNETLDVVLTEKSMLAAKDGITIACMADGEVLNGMDAVYLYSLFGNALDNAVECLQKADSGDNKVINVSVRRKDDMIALQFENYVPVPPLMKNGLPLTTKDDAQNHGYGLKSIRNIVENFGGNLRVDVRDDIFSLDILLPYPLKKR